MSTGMAPDEGDISFTTWFRVHDVSPEYGSNSFRKIQLDGTLMWRACVPCAHSPVHEASHFPRTVSSHLQRSSSCLRQAPPPPLKQPLVVSVQLPRPWRSVAWRGVVWCGVVCRAHHSIIKEGWSALLWSNLLGRPLTESQLSPRKAKCTQPILSAASLG